MVIPNELYNQNYNKGLNEIIYSSEKTLLNIKISVQKMTVQPVRI